MYSRWNGTAFEDPFMLNPLPMTVAGASWMGPDIVAHGDTIYIVFKQTPEDLGHMWILRSFDAGLTFSDPVRIDTLDGDMSRFPTVTTDESGQPIVAFMKFNTGFSEARWVITRSYDFGSTFSPDVLASGWSSQSSVVCDCCPGSIVSTDNTVAMLYRDNKTHIRDTWVGLSADGGESFTEGINVDGHNWMIHACPASGPDGVVIGDTLYSTFMNGASGKVMVYMNRTSLTEPQPSLGSNVTTNNADVFLQNFPRIAAYDQALGIAWKQVTNGVEQIVIKFTNDVSGELPAIIDTVAENNIMNVDLAIHDGKIFVVWEDDGSGTVKFRSGTFSTVTSVEDKASDETISVYPNPSSGDWTLSGNELKAGLKIEIFNIHGQHVYSQILPGETSNIKIGNPALNNGIYYLRLSLNDKSHSIKLVKY